MSVYVDQPLDWGKGSVKEAARVRYWCHMMADTVEELHSMAAQLSMPRAWYQGPPKHIHPHYDLTRQRRERALQLGAVEMPTDSARALQFLKKIAIRPESTSHRR